LNPNLLIMRNLEISLGNSLPAQLVTLNRIKDSQVMAILNHPAVAELTKEDDELATMILIYLEAKTAELNLVGSSK